ncbi:hypothetical protein ACFE04_009621 [Oxalis oulophora]
MANPISTCVLIALLFISSSLALASATTTTTDVPFIVAHKKATLTRLKSGADRVSVSIEIFNQGSSTAYDVTLNDNDETWPHDRFTVVSGNLSHSWERLDAGGILSHSFELESKTKGLFYGRPAVITFRVPTKAALQLAYSSPIPPLDILADKPAELKLDLAKELPFRVNLDKFCH